MPREKCFFKKRYKDSGITNSEAVAVPKRSPDAVVEMPTSAHQAQVWAITTYTITV